MIDIQNSEDERLLLQDRLDGAKTQAERNRLGQFATPPALASAILAQARQLLPPDQPVRFLDPAFGTGSFYSALLRTFPSEQIAAAKGFEVDAHYGDPARRLWRSTPLNLTAGDFSRTTPPEALAERSNLLICNPPYVRHHHIPAAEKQRLQQIAARVSGTKLSGLAGLYCYFLCLAHAWMADDALAGWLIPSEFMDVNYGEAVKDYLLKRVTLLRIHRFDPDEVQFDDALVSSALVWLRQTPPPDDHEVEFSYGGTLAAPAVDRRIPTAELRRVAKWTSLPQTPILKPNRHDQLRLGHLFTIKRGIATGANKFFILDTQEAVAHSLPSEFLTPILPGPRYLKAQEISADATGDPLLDRRLLLLNCRLPETLV